MKRVAQSLPGGSPPSKKAKSPTNLIYAYFSSEDGERQLIVLTEEHAKTTWVPIHEEKDVKITLYDTLVRWRDVDYADTGIASMSLEFFSSVYDLGEAWTEEKDEEWRTRVVEDCVRHYPSHALAKATYWAASSAEYGIRSNKMSYKPKCDEEIIAEIFHLDAFC